MAVGIALAIAFNLRQSSHWAPRVAMRLASLGYAIPGAVVVVGLLLPVGWLQRVAPDSGVGGPHGSENNFLLKAPFSSDDPSLCFKCHDRAVYSPQDDSKKSGFFTGFCCRNGRACFSRPETMID